MKPILVMLCTNDPDSGMDTGRCCAVEIRGDSEISIECQYADWGPRCYVKDGMLRFARRRFTASGEQDWVGNWCWRSVWMNAPEVLRLVIYLRELGWRIDHAESYFFETFANGRTLRLSDLLTAIFDGPTVAEKVAKVSRLARAGEEAV